MRPPNRLDPTQKFVADAAKIDDVGGPVFQAQRRLLKRLATERFELNPGILRRPISRKEDVDGDRFLWMSGYVYRDGEQIVVELRGQRLEQKGVTIL